MRGDGTGFLYLALVLSFNIDVVLYLAANTNQCFPHTLVPTGASPFPKIL